MRGADEALRQPSIVVVDCVVEKLVANVQQGTQVWSKVIRLCQQEDIK